AARPQTAAALLQALSACACAQSWSQLDAEAWWSAFSSGLEPPAAPAPPPSGEQPCMLVCRVDLEHRFDELERYLGEIQASDAQPGR
ncbi:MAG: hypothetical protein ABW217_13895, partial [Polyangiaceae bacterium]